MKYIYKITRSVLFLLAFILLFSACKKVLEVEPKGVLTEGVSSDATVDKLVYASYQALGAHFFGNEESFAGPASNWVMDVRSDDAWKGGGGIADRTDINQLETATMDPTNPAVFFKWQNLLFGISRTNFAIREIQGLESNTYPHETRIAEMKLLRGHFHFDLMRNYLNIPYIDEATDPTAATNTQYTTDELYARIEADFQYAYDNLPLSQTEVGRVNRYVAAAYLCKLYIETQQWQKAVNMADFVMQGPFALFNDYEDMTNLPDENGSEVVFSIQFSTANIYANHDWSNLLNVTASPGIDNGGYANGDDFYLASQNLINAFRTDENGLPMFDTYNNVVVNGNYSGNLDPRVDFSFGRIGIPWKGTANYDESWVRSTDYTPGYSCKKHVVAPDDPNIHNSFPWAASGLNFMLIRYAEVLLWKAEALIELGSNLETARTLINEVRVRAKNSTYVKTLDGSEDAANYYIEPYPAANWTQDYARQALRFERRLELALEGHRMYDLVRWGIATQTINNYYTTEAQRVDYLSGSTFVSGKHEYLPIPQNEIDLAPNLYSQNAGY